MIKIIADSTCDLSPELKEKYNVTITPIHVIMEGKDYMDGVDITPEDIFATCGGKSKVVCQSAAVNPDYYHDVFAEATADGSDVIHIGLSSEISSSFHNAQIAAEDFENVYVVDSRNLSTGSGHLVILAAEMAADGMAAKDIAEKLAEIAPKVDASFVIDTLEYLKKGGRCSALAALGANLLSLKPCIEVKDGKMGPTKKYRGNINKCLEQYVKDRLKNIENIDKKRIFVTSTMEDDKNAQKIVKLVKSYKYFDEVLVTRAGSVISCHCGPNCLGILYINK